MINPEWLKSQGFNISECGPTVAACAAHWSTDIKYNRFEARESNRRGNNWLGWWNLSSISMFLTSKGVSTRVNGAISSQPDEGELTIFRVRGNHFVMVLMQDKDSLLVFSTLFGGTVRETTWTAFKKTINWNQALVVYKNEYNK